MKNWKEYAVRENVIVFKEFISTSGVLLKVNIEWINLVIELGERKTALIMDNDNILLIADDYAYITNTIDKARI